MIIPAQPLFILVFYDIILIEIFYIEGRRYAEEKHNL